MDELQSSYERKASNTYGVEPSPNQGSDEESVSVSEPLALRQDTQGSAQGRLAWKTKSLAGASLSATNFGSVVNWNAGQQPQPN
jgi:hypothetical protein